MIDSHKVRLAYYESGDGPRLMLFGPNQMDLLPLQDCFRRLSGGDSPIDLHSQQFIFVAGDVRLRMATVGTTFGKKNTVALPGLRRDRDGANSFTWSRTNEGWDYLAELIESSVRAMTPGHQYLTSFPDEDAIVVVSRGEYEDNVLDS